MQNTISFCANHDIYFYQNGILKKNGKIIKTNLEIISIQDGLIAEFEEKNTQKRYKIRSPVEYIRII